MFLLLSPRFPSEMIEWGCVKEVLNEFQSIPHPHEKIVKLFLDIVSALFLGKTRRKRELELHWEQKFSRGEIFTIRNFYENKFLWEFIFDIANFENFAGTLFFQNFANLTFHKNKISRIFQKSIKLIPRKFLPEVNLLTLWNICFMPMVNFCAFFSLSIRFSSCCSAVVFTFKRPCWGWKENKRQLTRLLFTHKTDG